MIVAGFRRDDGERARMPRRQFRKMRRLVWVSRVLLELGLLSVLFCRQGERVGIVLVILLSIACFTLSSRYLGH